MGIKLDGMAELISQLERLGDSAKIFEEEALNAGANVVVEAVKDRVPVDTGNLKDNIVKSEVKDGKIEVGTSKDTFYGMFVEFGTSKMSAKPFLQPAFEQNVTNIEDAMANVIKRELGL